MTTIAETDYLDGLWQRQRELGWSDRELARRLGISKSQVSDIRRGVNTPGKKFDKTVASLFPDILAPQKPEVVESTALAQAIDDFLTAKRIAGKSPRTVDDFYAVYLRHFLMWTQQSNVPQNPSLIRPTHIRSFIAYLKSAVGRWGSTHPEALKQMSPGGQHAYYRTLKAFFHWLVREEMIEKSPVSVVEPPSQPHTIIPIFDLEDIKRMLEACGDDSIGKRNRAIILVFLDSGVRLRELAQIKLTDIDVDEQRLQVWGKGSRERVVRFGTKTKQAIAEYLACREELNGGSEYLWLSREGKPLSRRRIGEMIADLGRQTGITDVRCSPHTFRHTCATNLLRSTRDLYGVKTFLGHSTVIVTEKYLQTFSSEDALETHEKAAIVDRLLEL